MAYSGDPDEVRRKGREAGRRWREANAERDRENLRKWRAEHPEKVASQRARANELRDVDAENARRRERYDPAAMSAYRRAYYEKNRERILESRKARYAANPEPERIRSIGYQGIRRARMRGAASEAIDRSAIIARDKSRCHLCGKRVARRDVVLDHIIPLKAGGEHVAANVAVAHDSCNARKGARAANDQLRLVG